MSSPAKPQIDSRGPRVGAAITAILLIVVLLLGPGLAGTIVLALIVASFLLGAIGGVQRTWQGQIYARLVRPRLSPPTDWEDPAPPRFAQLVGLLITGVGLALTLAQVPWALEISAGLALAAAFLNAAFGLCLGCELYLLGQRLRRAG